jgi:hypothetical protein
MFSGMLQCCAIEYSSFKRTTAFLPWVCFKNQGTVGFGYLEKLESKNHGSQLFQKPPGRNGFHENRQVHERLFDLVKRTENCDDCISEPVL